MTHLSVILCETAPRWAPALRVALSRAFPLLDCKQNFRIAIHELSTLAELRQAVEQSPNSLLGIEIKRPSVGQMLTAIPVLLTQFPQCRAVALLNRAPVPEGDDSDERLATVLQEAGFLDVACSPRQLEGVVETCRRFASGATSDAAKSNKNRSFCEQVLNSLPWQPALPPVG